MYCNSEHFSFKDLRIKYYFKIHTKNNRTNVMPIDQINDINLSLLFHANY